MGEIQEIQPIPCVRVSCCGGGESGGGGGGSGGAGVHNDLNGRSAAAAHPISAITGLQAALDGASGGGGYPRPAVSDQEFIGLVQNSMDFASYHAFAQFAGDIYHYANAYTIANPVEVQSIDRNFKIVFGSDGKIRTYWQGKLDVELTLGSSWTGGGYSAFDYTGVLGDAADVEALKTAGALLFTGPEKVSGIDETLSAVSDLGEFSYMKCDKIFLEGPEMVLYTAAMNANLKDYTISIQSWPLTGNSNQDPNVGRHVYVALQNSVLTYADNDGFKVHGLIHFSETYDRPMLEPFAGSEALVNNGLYFVEVDFQANTLTIIETIYDGTNWSNPEVPHTYTYKLTAPGRETAYPLMNPNDAESNVFTKRNSALIGPELIINLDKTILYRAHGSASIIQYIEADSTLQDFNPKTVFAGDVFTRRNGYDISAPVRVYSIDKDTFIRFNVNETIDFVYNDRLDAKLEHAGQSYTFDGFAAFDIYGIEGLESDIETLRVWKPLSIEFDARVTTPKEILTSVSDAASRAAKSVQLKHRSNYTTIDGVHVGNNMSVWRILLTESNQFPDGPPDSRQYYVDNWSDGGRYYHEAACDTGVWIKSDTVAWTCISGGGAGPDLENKANKVIVNFPSKALRDVQYNETIANKRITLKELTPDHGGNPHTFRNVIGGAYVVDPEDGRPAMWFLIHYSEGDDGPSGFFDVPFGGSQPPLADNGIYAILIHFVGGDYHMEYEVLSTLYDGSLWYNHEAIVPNEYIQNNLNSEPFTSNVFNDDESVIRLDQQKLDLADALFIRQAVDNKELIGKIKDGSNVANYNPLCLYAGDQISINSFDWNIGKPVRIYSIDHDFYIKFAPNTGGGPDSQRVEFYFEDHLQIAFYSSPQTWSAIGFSAMDFMGVIGEEADIQELVAKNAITVTGDMKMVTTGDILTAISDTASRASRAAQIKKADNYPTLERFTPNVENAVWRINGPAFTVPGVSGTILWIEAWLENDGTVTRFAQATGGAYYSRDGAAFAQEGGAVNGGAAVISYSYNEQFAGLTWVDGRKIYQKTINFGTMPSSGLRSVAHGIPNFGQLVSADAVAINASDADYALPCLNTYVSANLTDVRIQVSNASWVGWLAHVTLRYTCTDR